jgi:hypothetical protein
VVDDDDEVDDEVVVDERITQLLSMEYFEHQNLVSENMVNK